MLFWLRTALFLSLLITASACDIKTRTIPDILSAGIALSGLILFTPHQIPGTLIALPFLAAALLCSEGMGGGDIKLMAASGFFLGPEAAVFSAITGLGLFLVFGKIYNTVRAAHGKERVRAFPLVPFLSAGCAAAVMIVTLK